MCRENLTIALCAPLNAPFLSFTCGKLHMVAEQRHVCEQARGGCICFFGTCGAVEKNVGTNSIDLASIVKVRCAGCAVREDNIGDRRSPQQIIESVLLQRPAIDPNDDFVSKKHAALLKELWSGANTCPFHVQPDMTHQPATTSSVDAEPDHSDQQAASPIAPVEVVTKAPSMVHDTVDDGWTAPATPPSPQKEEHSRKSSSDIGIKNIDCEIGLKSSRWAPQASEKSTEAPVKKSVEAPIEKPATQEMRRAPPLVFTRDPDNAVKVRDAAKMMANVKAFLVSELAT
ncbi:hypothetical protein ACHAPT_009209 [Fusarium lateritium]